MSDDQEVAGLAVEIIRFVDEYQPGFVECEFQDADGRRHKLVEKIPVLTEEPLWSDSRYPVPGRMPCTVLGRRMDSKGRGLVTISTEYPRHRRAADGLTEFTVLSTQISVNPRALR